MRLLLLKIHACRILYRAAFQINKILFSLMKSLYAKYIILSEKYEHLLEKEMNEE